MNKEEDVLKDLREEMIERLKVVKAAEERHLHVTGREDVQIDDIEYCGDAVYFDKETNEEQIVSIYAVKEGPTTKFYAGDTMVASDTVNVGVAMMPLSIPQEEYDSIKDIIETYMEMQKENPNLDEKTKKQYDEDKKEKLRGASLQELEKEKEGKTEGKEEGKAKKEDEEGIKKDDIPGITIDTHGATSLNQMVDGVTLRNILELGQEFEYIKPLRRIDLESYMKDMPAKEREYVDHMTYKDGIVAIRKDGTCMVLGDDVITPDRQEGNNSSDRDISTNVNGEVREESNTSSYKITTRLGWGYYFGIGYDEGHSSKKEIKISWRSGRDGDEEVEKELYEKGEYYQDPDQRNDIQGAVGHGEGDYRDKKQIERGNIGKATEGESTKVEDIDINDNNDRDISNERVPGTEITWKQFAKAAKIDTVEEAHKKFFEGFDDDTDPADRVMKIIEEGNKQKKETSKDEDDSHVRYMGDSARHGG